MPNYICFDCDLVVYYDFILHKKLFLSQITNKSLNYNVNAYAKPLTKAADIIDALVKQLTMPVRWVETVQALKADGVEALVEVGPNKVLCGLNRRIDKTLGSANVCNEATLAKALEELA